MAESQRRIFDCQTRNGLLTRVDVARNTARDPAIKFKVTHDLRRRRSADVDRFDAGRVVKSDFCALDPEDRREICCHTQVSSGLATE